MTDYTGVTYGPGGLERLRPTGDENVELLVQTMVYIDEHPMEWDQLAYARYRADLECGTAFCYAGHALRLQGWRPDFEKDPWDMESSSYFFDPGGTHRFAELAAREELGLTSDQATVLFHSNNSLERLRSLVSSLVGDAYTPPAAS